jgi:hypothetical protein
MEDNMKNLKVYHKGLIVVDMVNGFVREGGLHDKRIEAVIPYQKKLLDQYVKDGEMILFIKDCHEMDSVEHDRFGEIRHCIKGTTEAEIIDEFQPYLPLENVYTLEKNCTSFREAPGFTELMEEMSNIDHFDVVGCCTDICVVNGVVGMMNYFDQNNRRVEVNVHQEGIETYDAPYHDASLYSDAAYLLLAQQGAKVLRKEMN